jgi:hypothetical protein
MAIRGMATLTAGIVVLGLGACGDDDEGAGTTGAAAETTTPDLSKKEYLARADAVCLRVNQELETVEDDPEAFQQEGLPIIEAGLEDLRAIPPPPGDEERIGKVLTAGENTAIALRDAAEPPRTDPFDEFTRLADDYGFEDGCTRNRG